MLPIPDIVKALRTTRGDFAAFFQQAQVDLPMDQRVLFEVVGRSAADGEAFDAALRQAEAQGFLFPLLWLIIRAGLEDGSLIQALAATPEGSAELQAVTNRARNYQDPKVVLRGYANGIQWTCKVRVNGEAAGTGVLIGPNLVLTAWHVVRLLFIADPVKRWIAKDGSALNLAVEFDGRDPFLKRNEAGPALFSAHDDWCVAFSDCTADEIASRLPEKAGELKGYWDYAVIRLKESPGLERRWSPLDVRAAVPKHQDRVFVFQHPAGQGLQMDDFEIVDPDPPKPDMIPMFRFLHRANTGGGSSGGPCFDRFFMLFGLHQGEWKKAAPLQPGQADTGAINRGIPIVRVLEHLNQNGGLPGLDPSENPVWRLDASGNYAPVFGCLEFQKVVWQSAVGGPQRLITIGGPPRSGKTFRVQLLWAMLSEGSHLKVVLRSEAIARKNAWELARHLCSEAGATLDLSDPETRNTTGAAWLKDEAVPAIIRALDRARNGRLVWFCIADLNLFALQGLGATELLMLLYEQVKAQDWLRVVLDGMRGEIPASLTDVLARQRTKDITEDEVRCYLARLVAEMELPGAEAIGVIANYLFGNYEQALAKEDEKAVETLAAETFKAARSFLNEAER